MSYTFDKPYKSPSEQIQLLKERGLIFSNEDQAAIWLERIGYYTLINGYSKPFILNGSGGLEKYRNDITFTHIHFQYVIDYEFHNLLFPIMTQIENHLKTIMGDVVANHYGVNDKLPTDPNYIESSGVSYLDISRYQYSLKSKKVLRTIKKHILETRTNPTAYYRDKKNHIPPWILFRNLSLWQTNSFYRMLQPLHKIEVCSKFIPNITVENKDILIKTFADSFEIMREFRNCIAHGSRLYAFKSKPNLSFKGIENIFGTGTVLRDEYQHGIGKNDFFSLLLSIIMLLPTPTEKHQFIQKLELLIETIKTNEEMSSMQAYKTFMSESCLPQDFILRLKKSTNLI